MNTKVKRIVGLFALSCLLIIAGAFAKVKHWESLKPLMLVGLLMQTVVIGYALVTLLLKKDK